MQKFTIVLALMACAGHARRVQQVPTLDAKRDVNEEDALAQLLLALSPTGAFNPGSFAAGTAMHSPARANPTRMMFGTGPATEGPAPAPAPAGGSMFGAGAPAAPPAPAFGAPAPAAPPMGAPMGGGGGDTIWGKAQGLKGPAVVGMNIDRQTVFKGYDEFDMAIAAFQAAGLADVLSGPGPMTVFFPTNSAFKKWDYAMEGAPVTAEYLKKHIVMGKAISWDELGGDIVKAFKDERGVLVSRSFATGPPPGTTETVETLNGPIQYGVPSIGKRKMIDDEVWVPGFFNPSGREDTAFPHDVACSNGVIHGCDGIIP